MKILFGVKQKADFFSPLGLMQLSALAKKRGDETYLEVLSQDGVLNKIRKINPDVIAYTCLTGEDDFYAKVNKRIKKEFPSIFTLMGGPHPTFFPKVLDKAELDAICIGEGDYSFVELLDKLEKKEDVSKLRNIVVKGGKLNNLRPLVQDLDSLPFPDRELFYEKNTEVFIMNFMTGRGCPFKCTYCFNHALRKKYPNQRYLRRHSVDYVMKELSNAKENFGLKFVKFVDDVFAFKEDDWFKEFCERYPKEIRLPFYVHSRFDLMTPGIAKSLRQAGCKAVEMAIESSNQDIREKILQRKISDEQIINSSRYCSENGLSVVTCIMTGLPGSTLKDDIAGVDLCIKAGIPVPEFFVYQPYPGTELGEICVNEGFFDGDLSTMQGYAFSNPSVLNCFTPKEKNAQINISLLGPLAVRHPFLRNLIMNKLIHKLTNELFKKIYTSEKMWVYPSKVYKRKYSLRERRDIIKKAIKLEKTKRK